MYWIGKSKGIESITISDGGELSHLVAQEWTKEKPTKRGLYWVLCKDGYVGNCLSKEVLYFDGKGFPISNGEHWYKPEFFSYFLGPIEPPDNPSE